MCVALCAGCLRVRVHACVHAFAQRTGPSCLQSLVNRMSRVRETCGLLFAAVLLAATAVIASSGRLDPECTVDVMADSSAPACGDVNAPEKTRTTPEPGIGGRRDPSCISHSSLDGSQPYVFHLVESNAAADGKTRAVVAAGAEAWLAPFSGPFYVHVSTGEGRTGKSLLNNWHIHIGLQRGTVLDVPTSVPFLFPVGGTLQSCTQGIDAVAVSRADGSGTDIYLDAEGDHNSETAAQGAFHRVATCMSSGVVMLVDNKLNDLTVAAAASLVVERIQSTSDVGFCGLRADGRPPKLAIVINKNLEAWKDRANLHERWRELLMPAGDPDTDSLREVCVFAQREECYHS